MQRSRLSIPAVLSAMLMAIFVCLWVRGQWVGDSVLYAATDRYYFLRSVDGRVDVGAIEKHLRREDSRFSVFELDRGFHVFVGWSFVGLSPLSYFGVGPEAFVLWSFSLAHWLLAAAFSIMPLMWSYKWWTRRRDHLRRHRRRRAIAASQRVTPCCPAGRRTYTSCPSATSCPTPPSPAC